MEFSPTALPDVKIFRSRVYEDERGFFLEAFRANGLMDADVNHVFVQDNLSGSHKNVLRGLHYQIYKPQGKLVRAITGEIFDVAVDLRRSSPTFGRWVGEVLSAAQKNMLWIPPGFAHGFLVLSEWADVLYKTTEYYVPEADRTLVWNDPMVGIQWPLPGGVRPVLSTKDDAGATLPEADVFS